MYISNTRVVPGREACFPSKRRSGGVFLLLGQQQQQRAQLAERNETRELSGSDQDPHELAAGLSGQVMAAVAEAAVQLTAPSVTLGM